MDDSDIVYLAGSSDGSREKSYDRATKEKPLEHPRIDPFWQAFAKALEE